MRNKLPIIVVAIVLLTVSAQFSVGQELCGQWKGSWRSCKTGHQGRLNAQFCRVDATHVQAKFTGTFAKIVPFRYRPVLDIVHEEPGLVILQGTKRIPLGGEFEYNATISNGQFSATYRSKRDHGVWQIQR